MIDPNAAAQTLVELAAGYDQAALETWKGELNPGEKVTAALRDLASRLREGGRSATTIGREDANFLASQAARIRSQNEPLLSDDQVSPEWKANARAGIAIATQLEELAEWIRAGLEGRPSR